MSFGSPSNANRNGDKTFTSMAPVALGNRSEGGELEEIRRALEFERFERERLAAGLKELRERFDTWSRSAGAEGGQKQSSFAESNETYDESEVATADPGASRDDDAGSDTDPRDLAAVTRKRLDIGDAYTPNMSIWDAVFFFGHHCMGPVVSMVLALIWALNIAFQVWFCVIVGTSLTAIEDVSDNNLEGLLRWRIGTAHSVEFADLVAQRSMAAQVCANEDDAATAPGQLHLSALQAGFFDDIGKFNEGGGGMQLMLLAQFIWLCFILKEFNETFSFARSLYNIGPGKKTRVIVTESDPHINRHNRQLVRTHSGSMVNLVTLMMVTRVTSLSRPRFWLSMVLIVLPRIAIAMGLGYVGVLFLGKTSTMEDLVLNAIALAFVAEIDELFFKVFVPRRSHTLMENLEGFPMPHRKARKLAGVFAILKLITVASVLAVVYFTLLMPFQWRLDQAYNILCTGEKNFVYAVNGATGMVHVTRSQEDLRWTYEEKVLLQIANVTIDLQGEWNVSTEIHPFINSDFTQAVIESSAPAPSFNDVGFEAEYFNSINYLQDYTPAQAASTLSCVDLSSGQSKEATVAMLKLLLAEETFIDVEAIDGCGDIPWRLCSEPHMSALRAICPVTCACDQPPRYTLAYAGIYQTPTGGCPSQCDVLMSARNEVLYETASSDAALAPGLYSCTDIRERDFNFEEACVDTDQFTRAQDADGKLCSNPGVPCGSEHDDSDFSASVMCCRCGGGSRDNVGSSLTCLEDFDSSCRNMDLIPFWWLLYVRGLFENLQSQTSFKKRVENAIKNEFNLLQVEADMQDDLVAYVTSGNIRKSFLNGKWELMPGLPHPRNLTGCEYLASMEVKALLNIDLCATGDYRSIRYLCPETCGCTNKAFKPVSTNQADGYTEVSWLQFSMQRSQLSECPAACVLPHPSVDGDDDFDGYQPSDGI